jgi:hypothetical protein
VGSLRKGHCKIDRQVVEVQQGKEPAPFVSCFHGWCDWELLTKQYIDPRKVRLDVRQSMGLMGDMVVTMGKTINGLTVAQEHKLAEDIKSRQAKQMKEKLAKIPSLQDSVRNRVRTVIIQHEAEASKSNKTEDLDKTQEKRKVVADASFYSPVRVPPPFPMPSGEKMHIFVLSGFIFI